VNSSFKDKRITVMGLGLLGRGIAVAKFLAENGAKLTITDLKTKEQLLSSIEELEKFVEKKKLVKINFVLGGHKVEDFSNTDMVIRAPNAPLDSVYLVAARKAGVPVEMDASLFAKLAPGDVTIIGVTGTRGKTTTTHLIYEILKAGGKRVFIGGNVRNGVTLPLLKKVRAGDYVVLELDSWQLQGFGEAKISPQVAVFTSFMQDHLNYYKGDPSDPESLRAGMARYFEDKANVFKFQKKEDHLVINSNLIKNYPIETLADIHKVSAKSLDENIKTKLLGVHNLSNIACAVEVAEILNIPKAVIRKVVATFSPVEGRLEPLGKKRGVLFVNDNNSTTPDATIVALQALASTRLGTGGTRSKNIVLIFGGDDKKLDMSALVKEIPKYCSKVVMFKERGTDLIREQVLALSKKGIEIYEEDGLKATFDRAVSVVKKGELILFSPAFSSFGKHFQNEYDRGDQFVKLFNKLK
jgi:UDP-N-acetylmuramoylalanine--D-glutamate ligase